MTHVRDEGHVVVATPPADLTHEAVSSVLASLETCLQRGRPYVLVFDLSRTGMLDAMQRQRVAAHMKKNAPLIEQWVTALGVIAPSPIVRGAVTAIFWIVRPPVPYEIFASREEADAWTDRTASIAAMRARA